MKLLDSKNIDGSDGIDQGKFIGLADYHGGSFADTTKEVIMSVHGLKVQMDLLQAIQT